MKVINRFFDANPADAVLELETPRSSDDRGWFSVLFEVDAAAELGITRPFLQDNHSMSTRVGTVRGIHLQLPPHEQGKLVRIVSGRILDVVVDLRPDSNTLGEWIAVELSAEAGNQLWIPRGFGHGFCTLEPDTSLTYKVDNGYAPHADRSLAWNDPDVGIEWNLGTIEPTLSDKDANGVSLADIVAEIEAATTAAHEASRGTP